MTCQVHSGQKLRAGQTWRAGPGDSLLNKEPAEFSNQVHKLPAKGQEVNRVTCCQPKSAAQIPRATSKTEGKPVCTLQNRAFHHLYCPHPWRQLPPEPRTCWFCQAPGAALPGGVGWARGSQEHWVPAEDFGHKSVGPSHPQRCPLHLSMAPV